MKEIKPSTSADRNTFQRDCYLRRQQESGEPINQAYLDMFDEMIKSSKKKFDSPESRENNLEWDLLTTEWILDKVRSSESYAQNLYAALCNNDFQRQEIMPILRDQAWGCTWRYAGGIIADMRQQGDYIDWYCSGMAGGDEPGVYQEAHDLRRKQYVPEGVITDEVAQDLLKLGWKSVDIPDDRA